MKKYKTAFSLLAVVLTLCMLPLTAFAQDADGIDGLQTTIPETTPFDGATEGDGNSESEIGDGQTLYESLFGFDISTGNFAQLDVSSFYQMAEGFDMSAFQQLKYEIPSVEADATLLNVQYAALLENMQTSGYGTQYSITIPDFTVGYSSDIKANFQEVYGNVTSLGGFTMSDIMNATEETRRQRLQDFVGSDAYDVIYNNISLGRIMQTEKSDSSTSKSPSNSQPWNGSENNSKVDIKDIAIGSITNNGSANKGTNNLPDGYLNGDGVDDYISDAKNKFITTTPEELEEQFDANKGDVKQWVDNQNKANEAEISKRYYEETELKPLRKQVGDLLSGCYSDLSFLVACQTTNLTSTELCNWYDTMTSRIAAAKTPDELSAISDYLWLVYKRDTKTLMNIENGKY